MNGNEVFELLKSYLIEELEVEASEIVPEANLYEDLGLDSIDALDMVAMLEAKSGLTIEENELKEIRTIQNIIDYISNKTGQVAE